MQNSRDIKATLDSLLLENDQVFIVPHKRPDFDAIASSIGMSLICQKNNKKSYIVIDDEIDKLESETRKMIESIKDEFEVITSKEVKNLITDRSLMIAVDTNKEYLVPTAEYLKDFNRIFVLDHHKTDNYTIHTPYLFTDDTLSSASEEVSRLLFLYDIKLKPEYATYLLAGIILDTNKMSINVSKQTYEVAGELTSRGATVYLTRKDNNDLSTTTINRKRNDLYNRAKYINDISPDMYISIHLNASPSPSWRGLQVFYTGNNKENKIIAETITNHLKENISNVREIKKDNTYYMYKYIKSPGVLIEAGFISNPNDNYLLRDINYQNKLIILIGDSIEKYYQNK